MLLCLAQKPQKKNVSYNYDVVAFKEVEKENVRQGYGVVRCAEIAKKKCLLGLWCCGFPKSRDIEIFVKVMVQWLPMKPQKENVNQGYGVLAF